MGIRLLQTTPHLAREFNANQLNSAEWRSKFNLFRRAMSDDSAEKQRNLFLHFTENAENKNKRKRIDLSASTISEYRCSFFCCFPSYFTLSAFLLRFALGLQPKRARIFLIHLPDNGGKNELARLLLPFLGCFRRNFQITRNQWSIFTSIFRRSNRTILQREVNVQWALREKERKRN